MSRINNPDFVLFPIQNARSGYKPVSMPLVFVNPWVRTADNVPVDHSSVISLRYLIDNTNGRVPVAGYDHRGVFIPDNDRYSITISESELLDLKIDITNQLFFDQETNEEINYTDAVDGDYLQITLQNGNVTDRVVWYRDSDYYDLSSISIDTVDLTPSGHYKFVWEVTYYKRSVTEYDEFVSIDTTTVAPTRFTLIVNHPGEVHEMMVTKSPPLYFGQKQLSDDETCALYRPFADALQDIFDEQELLHGINWINKIPAELIPYLAYLLGWDLPFFETATDEMRRSVLRNARRLQEMKGTKRAITELFEILGFTVDVVGLWFRSDGKAFIAPGERLPVEFSDEGITTSDIQTTETLIYQYSTDGFGQFEIPLLHRPIGNIIINAYLVGIGSNADNDLANAGIALAETLTTYDTLSPSSTSPNSEQTISVSDLGGSDIGSSSITIDNYSNLVGAEINLDGPINHIGTSYNRDLNQINITLDRYIKYNNINNIKAYRLYIYTTYVYTKINLPEKLRDLRSNRFDITILKFKNGEDPPSDIIEFLLTFLFRIKAFHSLLRKLKFTITATGVYNVTDFCVGGRVRNDITKDAGQLQVPPAVIPTSTPPEYGFKDDDLKLRNIVIAGLEEEHQAWKNLDNQYSTNGASDTNITIPQPDGSSCQYTNRGQDRVIRTGIDPDQDDTIVKLCSLNNNVADYCYKGRVNQIVESETVVPLTEYPRCKPCELMLGTGSYYLTGVVNDKLSGLTSSSKIRTSWHNTNLVRQMAYPPAQLHYYNGSKKDSPKDYISNQYFAAFRPSLEINKSHMQFPGHRFVSMANLTDDYTSIYTMRPWDDILNIKCVENRPVRNGIRIAPDINPEIILNGDIEELTFDLQTLIYYGNGRTQDISTLADSTSSSDVTHSIFSTVQDSEFVVLDNIVSTENTSVCINHLSKIFQSANEDCECDAGTAGGVDYIDGYPALSGPYEVDSSTIDITSDMLTSEIIDNLGIELPDSTSSITLGYKLGSGIRVATTNTYYDRYKPYRLDCGCSFYECDEGETGSATSQSRIQVNRCNLNDYLQNGQYDFGCDKIDTTTVLASNEYVGVCSILLDGSIPSLLEISDGISHFKYVDSYNIIHVVDFERSGNMMDITFTTMDPRIPDRDGTGRIVNHKVFRTGLITTIHQIIELTGDGAEVLSEGIDQRIGEYQETFGCGDELPIYPFLYDINCNTTDDVEIECNGGTCIHSATRLNNITEITTVGAHGLSDGMTVTISDVPLITGNTANGTFVVTVIDDDIFSYGNTGANGGPVYGGKVQ